MCFLNESFARKIPEASSTLLRMHRLYLRQPPHDTLLYDTLHVSPNATCAEISKSYRRLSRQLHPDKTSAPGAREQLEHVREAYDVLKDDSTRLRYHRHGLMDARDAVSILTGRSAMKVQQENLRELLHLMGYYDDASGDTRGRVWYIATSLQEVMRPVLEGTLSEQALVDEFMQKCDRLKGLPLGAQILRCVGRAYRYSGHKALRRGSLLVHVQAVVRHAKHLATAAVAGGRLLVEEQKVNRPRRDSPDSYDRGYDEDLGFDLREAPSEEELQEKEQRKANEALLESLQIEALWKICKIELDHTIRQGCELLLRESFFYSSLDNSMGWVSGTNGQAVDTNTCREQLASLLVRLGNALVSRSKEGTSWME